MVVIVAAAAAAAAVVVVVVVVVVVDQAFNLEIISRCLRIASKTSTGALSRQ